MKKTRSVVDKTVKSSYVDKVLRNEQVVHILWPTMAKSGWVAARSVEPIPPRAYGHSL